MTKLLTSSNSLNSLADRLGLSVGTIRNNLNWEKGIKITDNESGKKTTVYLTEKGASIRTKALTSQLAPSPQRGEGATAPPKGGLAPKDLYPKVELINRTLYDLIPGRIHAIDINTLKDFGNYASQREL